MTNELFGLRESLAGLRMLKRRPQRDAGMLPNVIAFFEPMPIATAGYARRKLRVS